MSQINGRLQFDAVEMLQQARGLSTPGHAVITKEFALALEKELERLYSLEDQILNPEDNVVSWAEFQQLSEGEQHDLFTMLIFQINRLGDQDAS